MSCRSARHVESSGDYSMKMIEMVGFINWVSSNTSSKKGDICFLTE